MMCQWFLRTVKKFPLFPVIITANLAKGSVKFRGAGENKIDHSWSRKNSKWSRKDRILENFTVF